MARPLPPALQERLGARDLIVFDGECVLCSGFFRFVVRIDRAERFHFAHAQSALGAEVYATLDLPVETFETNIVVLDGVVYERMDAFAAVMVAVGWPWKAGAAVWAIPRPLRDWLYHRIARNRYAIFGRFDTCMMPAPGLMARFIDRDVA